MPLTVVLTLGHLLATWLPLTAALWGMVLVAYSQEWAHHRQLIYEAALAPAAQHWVVVERRGAEEVRPHLVCQELIMRRYELC